MPQIAFQNLYFFQKIGGRFHSCRSTQRSWMCKYILPTSTTLLFFTFLSDHSKYENKCNLRKRNRSIHNKKKPKEPLFKVALHALGVLLEQNAFCKKSVWTALEPISAIKKWLFWSGQKLATAPIGSRGSGGRIFRDRGLNFCNFYQNHMWATILYL